MYYLLGIQEVIKPILTLSKPYLKANEKITPENLQLAFRKYLIKNQYLKEKSDESPFILTAENKIEDYLKVLEVETLLKPKANISLSRYIKYLNEFIETQESTLVSIFKLLVHKVIFTNNAKHSGCASSQKAIGVIWIQPENHWTKQDLYEAIIHEMTHTIINIDELVYGHYKDKNLIQRDKTTWVNSAIRDEKRPLDAVLHSILVSIEIYLFRKNRSGYSDEFTLHPSTEQLVIQTSNSLKEIKILGLEKIKLRMEDILLSVEKWASNSEYEVNL